MFLYRLSSGSRVTIAKSKIALLAHPSVTSNRIVWVDQRSGLIKLRKQWIGGGSAETLWSKSTRSLAFWTTALEGRTAIVTRWAPSTGAAVLVRVSF